ncbi:hypothetical protein BDV09DRAFT_25466 [Aspergillus tetrazonus]
MHLSVLDTCALLLPAEFTPDTVALSLFYLSSFGFFFLRCFVRVFPLSAWPCYFPFSGFFFLSSPHFRASLDIYIDFPCFYFSSWSFCFSVSSPLLSSCCWIAVLFFFASPVV